MDTEQPAVVGGLSDPVRRNRPLVPVFNLPQYLPDLFIDRPHAQFQQRDRKPFAPHRIFKVLRVAGRVRRTQGDLLALSHEMQLPSKDPGQFLLTSVQKSYFMHSRPRDLTLPTQVDDPFRTALLERLRAEASRSDWDKIDQRFGSISRLSPGCRRDWNGPRADRCGTVVVRCDHRLLGNTRSPTGDERG
jgi:hypothetical protein